MRHLSILEFQQLIVASVVLLLLPLWLVPADAATFSTDRNRKTSVRAPAQHATKQRTGDAPNLVDQSLTVCVRVARLKTPQCPFIFNLYFQAQSPDTQTYTRFAIVFFMYFL